MFKGPARIKISLYRALSYSEKEMFRDLKTWSFTDKAGDKKTMFLSWSPQVKAYEAKFYPFHLRLSANEQVYAESTSVDSRALYRAVVDFLESVVVNNHPTAVKTLRELG